MTDRELLAAAFAYVQEVWDEGPPGEGWQSNELEALCNAIEARLAVPPADFTETLRARLRAKGFKLGFPSVANQAVLDTAAEVHADLVSGPAPEPALSKET